MMFLSNSIPENIAVILIDCWDSDDVSEMKIRQKLFDNIINCISSIKNIKLVVKGCYETNTYQPNQEIKNYEWENPSINILTIDDLKNFLNAKNITIDCFLIMGMHWDRCIKNRELGWTSIQKTYPESKIIFLEDCLLAWDNFLKRSYWPNLEKYDYLKKLSNGIFELNID